MRNVTILDSRARRLNDRLKLDSDRFTSEKQGPKSKVLVEEHSSVRTIILNRPKQLNALSSQMTTKGSFIVLIVGSIESVVGRISFIAKSVSTGSCYSVALQDNHSCVFEFLFDSVKGTIKMKCGHTMHMDCFSEMALRNQYRCPICSKSVVHMSENWQRLDEERMVVSLSSDKALWEAVWNNEVVRELRDSLSKADKSISGSSDKALEGSNTTTDIPSWLFVDTKAKVMELVDKITKLVNDLFQPPSVEEKASKGKEAEDNFQKIVKSSLMLSILVLLIVVVIRVRPT